MLSFTKISQLSQSLISDQICSFWSRTLLVAYWANNWALSMSISHKKHHLLAVTVLIKWPFNQPHNHQVITGMNIFNPPQWQQQKIHSALPSFSFSKPYKARPNFYFMSLGGNITPFFSFQKWWNIDLQKGFWGAAYICGISDKAEQ